MHTKWSEEIPPAVYIYEDRIEVVSNGGLPSALTKEDFFAGVSKPINKKLLRVFSDLDYIDQAGRGISLIVKNYGKNAFYISEHTIIVTIPLNKDLLEDGKDVDTNVNLSDAETEILKLIKNNPEYKMSNFIKETDYSEGYINKIIKNLKEKAYIKREGSNKIGYWKVIR